MKQTETEKTLQADPELDAVLEQMAEEVPPMPADFHDKWMNAVRAEAEQKAPAAEEKTEKAPVSLVRWTRILSIAATFVFLIGGTVLYRNSKHSMMDSEEIDLMPAVMMASQETVKEAESSELYTAGAVAGGAADSASYAGEQASAAKAASNAEAPAAYDMEPMMDMDAVMEDASEEAAVEYEAAAQYEASEMPVSEPSATASPTALVTEAVMTEAAKETAAEPAEEEKDGFLAGVKEFLADMGEFLLAALPYLLVLAVPAAAALVLRYRKKRKKE